VPAELTPEYTKHEGLQPGFSPGPANGRESAAAKS
jgi:hypothetical protein